MNRLNGLVIAGLVLMVGVTPSWGGPPNPTTSDANDNTAGGSGAVEAVTLGFANTGFGAAALSSNTAGAYNTATGAAALATNTDGSFNTATGAHALEHNVRGSTTPPPATWR